MTVAAECLYTQCTSHSHICTVVHAAPVQFVAWPRAAGRIAQEPRCFVAVCLLAWVCSHCSRRRMAGTAGAVGGAVGGACRSWQVDSICIWHTDCTKYANRQTMGIFCVIPLLQYFSLPTESTQKGSRRAGRPSPLCARPCRARTPARCGRRFKSGPRKGPRPCATNHMKDAASLQIALLKGIFDV